MADCFISYIRKDELFAQRLAEILTSRNLSVSLSSIKPDEARSSEILNNLEEKDWIIFLASEEACKYPCVLQELGMTLVKKLVPVVWDIDPDELPVWANRFSAIDLRNKSPLEISNMLSLIVKKIKAGKLKNYLSA